jgi:NAD(P)-dependent dehydrogenase (short-subunit alcohol dehydrogenase family)
MKLTGKVALVSGAGGGIGRAICLAFAEAEAAIACCDIDAASAEETVRLARNAGGRAIAQPCDVSVQAQTEAAAAAAHRAFGRVDILVSGTAPHDPSGTVLETSLADWDRVLAVDLTGSFLLSRAALPYVIEGGGGSIIFIASPFGRGRTASRRRPVELRYRQQSARRWRLYGGVISRAGCRPETQRRITPRRGRPQRRRH